MLSHFSRFKKSTSYSSGDLFPFVWEIKRKKVIKGTVDETNKMFIKSREENPNQNFDVIPDIEVMPFHHWSCEYCQQLYERYGP